MNASQNRRRKSDIPSMRQLDGQAIGEAVLDTALQLHSRFAILIAQCEGLTCEDMRRLTTGTYERVRCVIASRDDTDALLLDELANDASSNVRVRVACNPVAQRSTLARLLLDRDEVVRVAANAALQRLGKQAS